MIDSREGNSTAPEVCLITAIIMQAYRDLFLSIGDGNGVDQLARDQSISFLTDETGEFASHRNLLCSLIGWDGAVLAERVRLMMEGVDFPLVPANASEAVWRKHEAAVALLRKDWRERIRPVTGRGYFDQASVTS